MLNPTYNLPDESFVGGESRDFIFHLLTAGGVPFDANGCDVDFAVINYANKNGAPLVTKSADMRMGTEGVVNVAVVSLFPEDTVNLYGRYVYQLSIRDSFGELEIPGQGILNITRNINQAFVTS
jgi:hypothetical protein